MLRISKILNIIFSIIDVILFFVFIGLGIGFIANAHNIATSIPEHPVSPQLITTMGWVYISISFLFVIMFGLAIIYNQRLKKAQCKDDILSWSIIMMFFGYVLVGLFALLADDQDFEQNKVCVASQTVESSSCSENELIEKLKKLKDLHDQGLISEDEYNEKRKNIVNKL